MRAKLLTYERGKTPGDPSPEANARLRAEEWKKREPELRRALGSKRAKDVRVQLGLEALRNVNELRHIATVPDTMLNYLFAIHEILLELHYGLAYKLFYSNVLLPSINIDLKEQARALIHKTSLLLQLLDNFSPEGEEIFHNQLNRKKKKEKELMQGPRNKIIDPRIDGYLADKGVPDAARSAIIDELTVLIVRAKVPKWSDKEKPDHLKRLTAPEFLKVVHANAIKNNVVNKEEIRAIDPGLMAAVEAYIATRKRRQLDAGEARGLTFELRHPARNAPRPMAAKARELTR